MLYGSGLGAYVCDGASHGDIYLVCAWQLLQRLILKCAEVGGTDRWVPRQLIFIQRAWSLPGATCDLRHCLLTVTHVYSSQRDQLLTPGWSAW